MGKSKIIGMVAVALACGIMYAALCPGAALAQYCPDVLPQSVMDSATPIALEETISATVTNANEGATNDKANSKGRQYCDDTNVIRVYKFTAAQDMECEFLMQGDSIFEPEMYKLEGQTASLVPNLTKTYSSGSGRTKLAIGNLEKDTTYYFVAAMYRPSQNWSATVELTEVKTVVSGSVIYDKEYYYDRYFIPRVVFNYADGTSYSTTGDGTISAITSSVIAKDKYGNYFTQAKLQDETQKNDFSDYKQGTYQFSSKLYSCKDSSKPVQEVSFSLTLGTAAQAMAAGTPATTSKGLGFGFYTITAQRDGVYRFSGGTTMVFNFNQAKNILNPAAYVSTSGAEGYSLESCATKAAKGDKLYVIVTVDDGETAVDFYTLNLDGTKLTQTIKVKKASVKYRAKACKKRAKRFYIGASAKTACTYKVTKGAKWVKVNKKTGKVTVKKRARKGTYRVTVTARASNLYMQASRTITIKVK